MKGPRTAPRVVLAIAIVTLVGSIIGFIVTLLMNIFVWDKFDAYGEVPIPGSAGLHLPQGEVTVSFHTQIIGTTSGGGLPVPNMGLSIAAPDGVPDPQITEDIGSTTTVNSDARIRVWVVQIPVEGTYDVSTEGNVSAFVSPR
ncbi:MAG: SHOCT domain-containing protein, partial [Mycobacterium sp.]